MTQRIRLLTALFGTCMLQVIAIILHIKFHYIT